MVINNVDVNNEVLIIAEIGNNHEGSYTLAEEMIGLVAETGAQAVKFQTIVPELFIASKDQKRIQQLKKYQLSYNQFEKLANYSKKEGLIFMSTPFDLDSVQFLNSIVPAFKIASSDNTFYPLIEKVALTEKPIILSTGLAGFNEINKSVNFINEIWKNNNIKGKLALLHCVSNYPTNRSDANLLSIEYLKNKFPNCTIGYSDHTLGVDAAITSVVLGARIIEKHFTINKNHSEFRDHQISADPQELKEIVERVKYTQELLGEKLLKITSDEQKISSALRRSIAAKTDIPKGHTITIDDIIWVRPACGFLVGEEDKVIGKKTKSNIVLGEIIELKHLT